MIASTIPDTADADAIVSSQVIDANSRNARNAMSCVHITSYL